MIKKDMAITLPMGEVVRVFYEKHPDEEVVIKEVTWKDTPVYDLMLAANSIDAFKIMDYIFTKIYKNDKTL